MAQRTILPLDVKRESATGGELMSPRRSSRKRPLDSESPIPAIIRSKVQSPVVRASTLERPRLLGWLERHDSERVRIVAAEAGYGKTTLLADFARRSPGRTLWYRMDSGDGEWLTLLSYLIAAMREAIPEFGSSTLSLLSRVSTMGTTRDVALRTFLAELGTIGHEAFTLILDDFHLVQGREDVHHILERLFERAPASVSFILAGRQRPVLRLGRLAGQGGVIGLTTNDLRFSLRETEDLFAQSYGLRLDEDIVGAIDARTEGWGASLQLVYSSIRSLGAHDVRSFVHDLSGTTQPIYDFLAEEVLGRQPPVMQRVLIHASLLDRVVPLLVLAALAVSPDTPGADTVVDCLDEADEQGLMSRNAAESSARRFHPLLRTFLVRQLQMQVSPAEIRGMHLRIARAAEPADWLTSANHYIEAGHAPEAMRVLGESTLRTLGTGTWGAATQLIARMPEVEAPLAVQVISARALVAAGKPDDALDLLLGLSPDPADPVELGIHRLARATAYHYAGRAEDLSQILIIMDGDASMPRQVAEIAHAWSLILVASGGGPLLPARDELIRLGGDQAKDGLHYFAAVSYHNAMMVELARGDFAAATKLGDRSLSEYRQMDGSPPDVASTRAVLALCSWEGQHLPRARDEAYEAASRIDASADALVDCAWIAAAAGQVDQARSLLHSASRSNVVGTRELGVPHAVRFATALTLLARGDVASAADEVAAAIETSTEPDAAVRMQAMRALVAVTVGSPTSASVSQHALEIAVAQGAARWEPWLAALSAIARRDSAETRRWVTAAAVTTPLSFLAIADAIGTALNTMDPSPPELEASMAAFPERWLPILRRQLSTGNTTNARSAAMLLARFGTLDDVPRLVTFERKYVRLPSVRRLGRQLARHLSPTLLIHDLGRIAYEAGPREVRLSQTRRKAAALLIYLASRPRQTATREQVLEDLWPDQDPPAAANSLHQTAYFLRRDIEPWYDDGISADYVAVESEVVYLDADLVQVDSAAFLRQSAEILANGSALERGASLLKQYLGTFAPEFEYEEWSLAWRDRVHSTFLQLTQTTSEALASVGAAHQAVDVLSRALIVDPTAVDLETSLICALLRVGARAAAIEQYGHYAQAYRREYGVEPLSMAELETGSRYAG